MFNSQRQDQYRLPANCRWRQGVVLAGLLLTVVACKKNVDTPPPGARQGAVLGGEVVYRAARGDQQIQGAVVELSVNDRKVAEVITDADGRFRLNELPSGPFNLRVTKGGDYEDYEHHEKLDAATFPNGRRFLKIAIEGHLTVLAGKVLTADGKPVSGAKVRTYPGNIEDTTSEDGSFKISSGQFESVEYRVEVSKAGFEAQLSEKLIPSIGMENQVSTITLSAYEVQNLEMQDRELNEGGNAPGKVVPGNQ